MKTILNITLLIYCLSIYMHCQDKLYWKDAPTSGTKIFTISFTDNLNGKAISGEGDILITKDGGENWTIKAIQSGVRVENADEYIWVADIYCSVMQTTDSGSTWFPYDKGKQEHFCGVYLKDNNSGYNIAGDFLNKVITKILDCSNNNKLNLLIDRPQQCTEYYSSASEGWALGWCIRSFEKQ